MAALLLAPLALLLAMCGTSSGTVGSLACVPVRGDETSSVSVWSCASDDAASALRAEHDFSFCARRPNANRRLYECSR